MAITATERTKIIELTVLMFNAAPGSTYLSQIVSIYEANGHNLQSLALTLAGTGAYQSLNPNFQTAADFATAFLTPLGLEGDTVARDFVIARFNAGASKGAIAYEGFVALTSLGSGASAQYTNALAILQNKTAVAEYYSVTKSVAETDLSDLQNALVGVTADPATVTAAEAAIDGGSAGETITLKTGVDTVKITSLTSVDTVVGVIDGGTPANSTFSIGDTITGNGKTILQLAVATTGAAAFTTVSKVGAVDIVAGAAGTVTLNAVNWSEVGAVNLLTGVDGLEVDVNALNAGADLSVGVGVSGSVSASYTNDIGAWVYSDRGSSIAMVSGGAVTGVVDASGSASASIWASGEGVALSVGDVSITAAGNDGSDAYFGVYNGSWNSQGGDITVGNVTMTGLTSDISLSVESWGHTASSKATNVTVGNVTLSGVGSASVSLDISNTSAGPVGNLTVGNVALTTGKNGDIDAYIALDGVKTAGNLAVGSVTVVGGVGSSASITISNEASAAGTKAATIGTSTVGGVGFNLAQSASLEYSFSASAYASGTGKATVGNVALGGFTGVLGQNASASVSIDVSAYSSGGAAAVGSVAIGASSFTLAVDASVDYSVSITAYSNGGKAATVGSVSEGALSVTAGINTTFSATNYIEAIGSTASSIGDVSVGAVTMVGDDGSYLNYYHDITSDGKLGNVSIGGLTETLGVSATGYWDHSVEAMTVGNLSVGAVSASVGKNSYFWGTFEASGWGGDVGTVNVGNVSMTAGASATAGFSVTVSASNDLGAVTIGSTTLNAAATSAYAYASYDFSAWSGDIGNVTVGDVSLSAGKSATASYYFEMSGETSIGNVTVGNVTLSSVGASAYAYAYLTIENDSVGTIGDFTVGNVKSTVNGAGAYGGFYVSVSSAASAGTLTVGNLDLSIGNAASKTGAYLEVDIVNTLESVTVGNISLTATGVRSLTDTTIAYDADVAITAADDIVVGNITVTGGDGKAEDFGTLTNWLTLTAGGTKTIGGVDYSGYGAVATLDVSGYLGAAFVKGGAKADVITDNKGANALTGNGGADTFKFVDTNTGKTEATADSITDFSNTGGDKIDLTPAVNVGNYGEATFADFASFLTGAEAANKAVFVGQIGGDSFVAVDKDGGLAVDFVIKLAGVSLSQVDVASFI